VGLQEELDRIFPGTPTPAQRPWTPEERAKDIARAMLSYNPNEKFDDDSPTEDSQPEPESAKKSLVRTLVCSNGIRLNYVLDSDIEELLKQQQASSAADSSPKKPEGPE
jgi:hypothetical protein